MRPLIKEYLHSRALQNTSIFLMRFWSVTINVKVTRSQRQLQFNAIQFFGQHNLATFKQSTQMYVNILDFNETARHKPNLEFSFKNGAISSRSSSFSSDAGNLSRYSCGT